MDPIGTASYLLTGNTLRNIYNAGKNLFSGGGNTQVGDATGVPDYSNQPVPQTTFGDLMPQSLADNTGNNTGGGTGAGAGTSTITSEGVPLEGTEGPDSAYDEATRLINDAYNAGLGALSDIESTLQPGFEQTRSGLLAEQETKTGQARAEEAQDLSELAENQAQEQRKTDSAIALARREAGEMMTGLASRFGGSTGTGIFAGELTGRQALENIAGARNAMAYVRGQITQASNRVKLTAQTFVDNLELQTQQLIARAQEELRAAQREIANRRDMLAQQKADRQLDALYRYQDSINSINQRNTALKQDIFLKAQDANNKLAAFAQQQVQKYNLDFQPGEKMTVSVADVPGNQIQDITTAVGNLDLTGNLQGEDDTLFPTN